MPLPSWVVEIRKLEKSVFTGPVVSSCWDVISWTVPINRPDHPVSGVIIALPRCGRQVSDGTLTKRVLWVTWVGWICYGCVLAWDQRLTWRSHPIRQWRLIITRQIWSYAGIGAVPITDGKPDLNWQITMKYNWGLSATLFNERINIDASYYKNKTKDALMPISLPWSVGVSSVQVNMGKLETRCEFASRRTWSSKKDSSGWSRWMALTRWISWQTCQPLWSQSRLPSLWGLVLRWCSKKAVRSLVFMPCVRPELIRHREKRFLLIAKESTRLITTRMNG